MNKATMPAKVETSTLSNSENASPTRATKITESTLTDNLLFAFFGHRQAGIRNAVRAQRDELLEELNELFIEICDDVAQQLFDRQRHKWITDKIISQYFENKKFHQAYTMLKKDKQTYRDPRSIHFRNVMAVLCAVSRDIFDEPDCVFPGVLNARQRLGVDADPKKYLNQTKVLGEIERELRKIPNKSMGAVRFEKDDIVIKLSHASFFPHRKQQDADREIVGGRWLLYRKLFERVDDCDFIREYVVIDPRKYGIEIQWYTNGGHRTKRLYTGSGLFTDGALWLIAHCSEPFKRMRVLTASIREWGDYVGGLTNFCTAQVLGHRDIDGRKDPQQRRAVLRKESEAYWENREESYDDRVKLMTESDLLKELSSEEVQILNRE